MEQRFAYLIRDAAQQHIEISEDSLSALSAYWSLLHLGNKKINLFAPVSVEKFIERHFIDSLAPSSFFNFSDKTIVDIGSGAGFSAIPLAITSSPRTILMVKASFLRHAISVLSLTNVCVVNVRVEDLTFRAEHFAKYDFIISRASLTLSELLSVAPNLLHRKGALIAMKGPASDKNLDAALMMGRQSGMCFIQKCPYILPQSGHRRNLLVFTPTTP